MALQLCFFQGPLILFPVFSVHYGKRETPFRVFSSVMVLPVKHPLSYVNSARKIHVPLLWFGYMSPKGPCVKGLVSRVMLLGSGGSFRKGSSRRPLGHWRVLLKELMEPQFFLFFASWP
jgi:hypothetical protein